MNSLFRLDDRVLIPSSVRMRQTVSIPEVTQPQTPVLSHLKYYDNTRISDYRNCPRYFYLRHIRDWRSQYTSLSLVNGSSWHEAMDVVWDAAKTSISDIELTKLAHLAYVNKWVEEGLKHPDQMTLEEQEAISPRGPFIARSILFEYITARRDFIKQVEVLDIERPFAIPIIYNPDGSISVWYIGRLDKVMDHSQYGKIIAEHKTTSWYSTQGFFRKEFLDGFSPNSQVDGYIYAGNLLYESIKGVWIDAALFHKKVHNGFRFIPVDRQFEMIDQWKADTLSWIERIESDYQKLQASGNLEGAFPKNTGSCGNYGGCTYRDVCRFYVDPSTLTGPPPGFIEQKWNPFDVLHIDRIAGMTPESDNENTSSS